MLGTRLDLAISGHFFDPARGWFMKDSHPWDLLHRYGCIPGLAMGIFGLLAFVFGLVRQDPGNLRKTGLFLVLVLALGPGLLVSVVFKDHWNRPRPVNVADFGGTARYLPVWTKGPPGGGHSFPSGHASMGFYLLTPFFAMNHRHRKWALFFLGLGLFYGVILGTARIVQGGHFASDILWAGGFTYLTGLITAAFLRFEQGIVPTPSEP